MTTALITRRHTDRVFDVVRGGLRGEISDTVAQSWARCVNDYRLDPACPRRPTLCDGAAIDERRARLADVIDCARYEMTTLFQQLSDPMNAVVLTDTDGVILHLVSSPEFAGELEPSGFRVGAMWSEAEAGTNGMGTCLAAQAPISVRQDDHFFSAFTSLTCSAVPVYDPEGRMAAVLDVTSRSALAQQHVLVLLGMTARMIENRLFDRLYRGAHPLHFHSRPEFVHTLHEGRLALDDEGRVLAANRSALIQMGVDTLDEVRSRRIDEVFQTSLGDLLQRSRTASFHPVAIYRAHGAHRFFAVARAPAAEAESARAQRPVLAAVTTASVGAQARRAPRRPAAGVAPELPWTDATLDAHFDIARKVIARGTPVLLRGETGAGKEVFARALHERSPSASGTFVAVNCASLPESLIEAELFGYRAGAFTGAQRSGRRGKILQADGGTLFLDEIGDMPLSLQARLLRVLDERQVMPLGTDETQPVEFQLVSASHRNLASLVAEGLFREDLYYRLNGIELQLPPLRERADRRALIDRILAEEAGRPVPLSAAAEQLLMEHRWPGNLRQMRHVLRTAAALADDGLLLPRHLAALASTVAAPAAPMTALAAPAAAEAAADEAAPEGLNVMQAQERRVLLQMLDQHRWNVSNVAKALDVSRNTLYRKLHRLRIPVSPRA